MLAQWTGRVIGDLVSSACACHNGGLNGSMGRQFGPQEGVGWDAAGGTQASRIRCRFVDKDKLSQARLQDSALGVVHGL